MRDLPQSIMRANLLAAFAMTGAALFGFSAMVLICAQLTLFNPAVYKDELRRMDVYRQFPVILGQTMADEGDLLLPGVGERLVRVLDAAHYDEVARMIFPESWARAQTESLIDQFWAFFNLRSPSLSLRVDFGTIKERLSGEQGVKIAEVIVQGLPACTGGELMQFGMSALSGQQADLPLCRPPDPLLSAADGVVSALLRAAADAAPERVNFAQAFAGQKAIPVTGGEDASPGAGWQAYTLARRLGPWLPLPAALCLGLAAYFGRFTRRGAFFWAGSALAAPGILALLGAVVLGLAVRVLAPEVINRFFFASLSIFLVLVDLLTAVASRYVIVLGAAGAIMALVGLGLVAVGVRRRE